MELKSRNFKLITWETVCLNRTFMELKCGELKFVTREAIV